MKKFLEYLIKSKIICEYRWTRNGLQIVTNNIDEFVEQLPVCPWHPLDMRCYGFSYVIERFDDFLDGYIDFELTEIFPKRYGKDNVDSEGC